MFLVYELGVGATPNLPPFPNQRVCNGSGHKQILQRGAVLFQVLLFGHMKNTLVWAWLVLCKHGPWSFESLQRCVAAYITSASSHCSCEPACRHSLKQSHYFSRTHRRNDDDSLGKLYVSCHTGCHCMFNSFPASHYFCHLLSRLLVFLDSLYCKQMDPDQSYQHS